SRTGVGGRSLRDSARGGVSRSRHRHPEPGPDSTGDGLHRRLAGRRQFLRRPVAGGRNPPRAGRRVGHPGSRAPPIAAASELPVAGRSVGGDHPRAGAAAGALCLGVGPADCAYGALYPGEHSWDRLARTGRGQPALAHPASGAHSPGGVGRAGQTAATRLQRFTTQPGAARPAAADEAGAFRGHFLADRDLGGLRDPAGDHGAAMSTLIAWGLLALFAAGFAASILRDRWVRLIGMLAMLGAATGALWTAIGPVAGLWVVAPGLATAVSGPGPARRRLVFDPLVRRAAVIGFLAAAATLAALKFPIGDLPRPLAVVLWNLGALGVSWIVVAEDARESLSGTVLAIAGGAALLFLGSGPGGLTVLMVGALAAVPALTVLRVPGRVRGQESA